MIKSSEKQGANMISLILGVAGIANEIITVISSIAGMIRMRKIQNQKEKEQ